MVLVSPGLQSAASQKRGYLHFTISFPAEGGRTEPETHQQWREEERQDELPPPVQQAGEGHGGGSAGLVEELGGDEPGDGAGAQLVRRHRAEDQQHLQAAQLREQGLQADADAGSGVCQKRGDEADGGREGGVTRTESTTVISRLQPAMKMKPVSSSFLRPALSIKKNCRESRTFTDFMTGEHLKAGLTATKVKVRLTTPTPRVRYLASSNDA